MTELIVQRGATELTTPIRLPHLGGNSGVVITAPFFDRIIDDKERKIISGVSRSRVPYLEEEGRFPARLKLGQRRIGWRLSQVLSYVQLQMGDERQLPLMRVNDPKFVDRLVGDYERQTLTSLSQHMVYRLEKSGDFPKRTDIGVRQRRWLLSEILNWMDTLPHSDDLTGEL